MKVTTHHWKPRSVTESNYHLTPLVTWEQEGLSGEECADLAFHMTNAPSECLTAPQKTIVANFRGPSLSVGDFVEAGAQVFRCESFGWREVTRAEFEQAKQKELSPVERWR